MANPVNVLLVIDMLNDFMDPGGALYCGDAARKIIPAVRSLIDRFTAEKNPVIYLCDAHDQKDREFELFSPHAVAGTWGAEIIPQLRPPERSIVLAKTRFSAFYKTDLDRVLASVQPQEVWLSGVCTSICIMDTAGDLRNRDYSAVVPVDAVADFDPEYHAFALKRMERVYGVRLTRVSA
ncbi:MAG: cysteine hydrolase [Deltaproteobacteria bacterium]|nr:cysteine hydrolase [Deltaproteobacteria bacterium]